MAKSRLPEKSMPTYSVFVVDEQEGKEPFWLKVGAAFEHKDGKGLNLVLQALPVTNRLVLREYKEPEKDWSLYSSASSDWMPPLAVALFLRESTSMTMPSTAEAREVYRNMEYLKELGYLAAPGEHPGLALMLEIYKTAGIIRDALMRVKPGMMAERDGYARISQMQAALWLDTDGEQTGALVSMMLGPMMFILICGNDWTPTLWFPSTDANKAHPLWVSPLVDQKLVERMPGVDMRLQPAGNAATARPGVRGVGIARRQMLRLRLGLGAENFNCREPFSLELGLDLGFQLLAPLVPCRLANFLRVLDERIQLRHRHPLHVLGHAYLLRIALSRSFRSL